MFHTRPTDPIGILRVGIGRCGEFSILFTAACLAVGYQARMAVVEKNDFSDASCVGIAYGVRKRLFPDLVETIVPISWRDYVRPIIEDLAIDPGNVWVG